MRNHSYKDTLLETFCSFPIGQLKGYSLKDALSDLISGLTVAFVRIPQGMAYAFLAGVQPQYGLYTGIDIFSYLNYGLGDFSRLPRYYLMKESTPSSLSLSRRALGDFYRWSELYSCVFYALFATSKHNSVGSTSIMSMLSGDVIENAYPDLGKIKHSFL